MIYFFTTLSFFLVASFTDLKRREVSDTLSTGLIAIGITLHAWESFLTNSPNPLLSSIYMALLAFAFSYFLYRIGAWAGGDVKLFTGLGAALPHYGSLDYFPFLVFASAFLAALPFLLVYISYYLITVKKLRQETKPVLLTDFKRAVLSALFVIAAYELTLLLNVHALFAAPLIYVFYKFRKLSMSFAVILMVFFFLADQNTFLTYFGSVAIASFLLFFSIHSFRIARDSLMRRTVSIGELEEGMIPAEDVYIGKTKAADSKLARGLTPEEIAKLKKARKTLQIKLSVPFVPVLTLGMIILFVLEKVIK